MHLLDAVYFTAAQTAQTPRWDGYFRHLKRFFDKDARWFDRRYKRTNLYRRFSLDGMKAQAGEKMWINGTLVRDPLIHTEMLFCGMDQCKLYKDVLCD